MTEEKTVTEIAETPKSSNKWILFAMGAGFFYGIGNTIFGIHCSQLGIFGAGFIGPSTFLLVALYRMIESCRIKRRMGSFIDKENSAYWRKVNNDEKEGPSNDDFQTAPLVSGESTYELNWHNINIVVTTQALMMTIGLIFVAYAFKFALSAGMNQGCIPSLFTVCSIYIAVLFYFKFNEVLNAAQIVGIILMMPCVILLSLDPKDEADTTTDTEEASSLTSTEMRVAGLFAVLFGCTAPVWWTIKSYFIRRTAERKEFPIYDLGIDQNGF